MAAVTRHCVHGPRRRKDNDDGSAPRPVDDSNIDWWRKDAMSERTGDSGRTTNDPTDTRQTTPSPSLTRRSLLSASGSLRCYLLQPYQPPASPTTVDHVKLIATNGASRIVKEGGLWIRGRSTRRVRGLILWCIVHPRIPPTENWSLGRSTHESESF